MRYLGYTVEEFEKIDITDFELLMEAIERREEDKHFWTHWLAWQTMRAGAKKKSGKVYKLAYPRFKGFYDAEAAENERKNKKKSRFGGLSDYLRKRKEGEIEDGGLQSEGDPVS